MKDRRIRTEWPRKGAIRHEELLGQRKAITTIRQFDRITAGDAPFDLAPLGIARDGHGGHGREGGNDEQEHAKDAKI